ncbi:MAG: putative capsule-related protein [Pedobacter sp.]|nr:putative capsule-related protein [Pedobacter sp.]
MSFYEIIWLFFQICIGYNLILPFFFYLVWIFSKKSSDNRSLNTNSIDYAVIVTAYGEIGMLPSVIHSILASTYHNYLIYIVADNCNVEGLTFSDPRVILLSPPEVLSSNTRSHLYAFNNFRRKHDVVTIVDSDNLLHKEYFNQLNADFHKGFDAVQGLRAAKNLKGTIACLDAARDIYYHFYDGQVLFELGSSATLAGSGMAFKADLYREFLTKNQVSGAGFDKVLQSWLVKNGYRIAFNGHAIIFDEKTSKSEQLVHQRSRWINTWFKYFSLGFQIAGSGITGLSKNMFLFGIVLLRPPLFLFLLASLVCLLANLILGFELYAISWVISFVLFVFSFVLALIHGKADPRIYQSLVQIPRFIMYQVISLLNVRKANKISVATKHFVVDPDHKN